MAKLSFAWLVLIALSQMTNLSAALEEYRFFGHYIELVHQGEHENVDAALNDGWSTAFNYEFAWAVEQSRSPNLPNTKSVTAPGSYAVINPGNSINRRVYITGVHPGHHRTETRVSSWKDVLGVSLSGVILGLEEGEGDQGKINELERQNLTIDMIRDARGRCDAYNKAHPKNGGNCIVDF